MWMSSVFQTFPSSMYHPQVHLWPTLILGMLVLSTLTPTCSWSLPLLILGLSSWGLWPDVVPSVLRQRLRPDVVPSALRLRPDVVPSALQQTTTTMTPKISTPMLSFIQEHLMLLIVHRLTNCISKLRTLKRPGFWSLCLY